MPYTIFFLDETYGVWPTMSSAQMQNMEAMAEGYLDLFEQYNLRHGMAVDMVYTAKNRDQVVQCKVLCVFRSEFYVPCSSNASFYVNMRQLVCVCVLTDEDVGDSACW